MVVKVLILVFGFVIWCRKCDVESLLDFGRSEDVEIGL